MPSFSIFSFISSLRECLLEQSYLSALVTAELYFKFLFNFFPMFLNFWNRKSKQICQKSTLELIMYISFQSILASFKFLKCFFKKIQTGYSYGRRKEKNIWIKYLLSGLVTIWKTEKTSRKCIRPKAMMLLIAYLLWKILNWKKIMLLENICSAVKA